MTSKKGTNQEHGDAEHVPHLPASVYHPDPFPLNPSEGNPWARSNPNLPYIPPYQTNNSDPYENRGYYQREEQTGGYKQRREIDINDDAAFSSTGGSIEPPDPAKLNENKSKVSPPVIQALHNRRPNGKRLLLRFIQFLASVGAFGFIVGAPAYSGESTPFNDQTAIIFLYLISVFSAISSFVFLANYCVRRYRNGEKVRRWIMLFVDLLFATAWCIDMFVLIGRYGCKPGNYNHWCDFFNTAIFFGVCAFATYAISFVWDVIGACSSRARMNYNA